ASRATSTTSCCATSATPSSSEARSCAPSPMAIRKKRRSAPARSYGRFWLWREFFRHALLLARAVAEAPIQLARSLFAEREADRRPRAPAEYRDDVHLEDEPHGQRDDRG